jgi:hypothetical protein
MDTAKKLGVSKRDVEFLSELAERSFKPGRGQFRVKPKPRMGPKSCDWGTRSSARQETGEDEEAGCRRV